MRHDEEKVCGEVLLEMEILGGVRVYIVARQEKQTDLAHLQGVELGADGLHVSLCRGAPRVVGDEAYIYLVNRVLFVN